MNKIVLDRKNTYQDYIDVVLCHLPDSNEYVTWLINRSWVKSPEDNDLNYTVNGHYFRELEDAKKDFDKRS
jgi:hypothetical protein